MPDPLSEEEWTNLLDEPDTFPRLARLSLTQRDARFTVLSRPGVDTATGHYRENCATKLKEDDRFCHVCGAPAEGDSKMSEAPTTERWEPGEGTAAHSAAPPTPPTESEAPGTRLTLTGIAALVVVAVLAGCGGGTDSGEEQPKAQQDEPAAAQEEQARAGALAEIREDFGFNFAGKIDPSFRVSWATDPENLDIVGTTLEAHTGWYPDAEGDALALQLCRALRGNYVIANTADFGLESVVVYGGGDPESILASTSALSGECKN